MKKSVLFVSSLFPSESEPFKATFNVSIVQSILSRMDGVVLAPARFRPFMTRKRVTKKDPTENGSEQPNPWDRFRVIRPRLFLQPLVGRSFHWLLYFLSIFNSASRIIKERGISCIYSMYAYPDGAASVLLALASKRKIIVHTMGCDINLLTRLPLHRAIIRWALKRADHIVSVSLDMKNKLIGLGIQPQKISVVYNGVDGRIFKPMEQMECREQLGVPITEKSILFVGSLEEVKGVDTLLDAFSMLVQERSIQSPCALYLIGDGTMRQRFEREVARSGLSGQVHLLGQRSGNEIAKWMNACDVFCLPSIREGLPNVILEAMSCHRPVVASDVGGIPEVLAAYPRGWVVEPSRPGKLKACLVRTLSQTEQEAGITFETYSWERFSLEVSAIIDRITMEGSTTC